MCSERTTELGCWAAEGTVDEEGERAGWAVPGGRDGDGWDERDGVGGSIGVVPMLGVKCIVKCLVNFRMILLYLYVCLLLIHSLECFRRKHFQTRRHIFWDRINGKWTG